MPLCKNITALWAQWMAVTTSRCGGTVFDLLLHLDLKVQSQGILACG